MMGKAGRNRERNSSAHGSCNEPCRSPMVGVKESFSGHQDQGLVICKGLKNRTVKGSDKLTFNKEGKKDFQ